MSNKYTYSVPFTEEQLYEDYYTNNMSQSEIAQKYQTTQRVVWRAMKKCGMKSRKAVRRDATGPNSPTWKGGRILVNHTNSKYRYLSHHSQKGYWMVKRRGHPNADRQGYVMEHIVVALEFANREKLEPNECVHHINFDKRDNNPLNLHICTHDKHREYHGKLESLTKLLLDRGIVQFDAERGYVIVEDA